MKILSDFDGVLTDLSEEADRVMEIFTETLQISGGLTTREAQALTHTAELTMIKDPTRHGWRDAGRVTAFWNEDGFIKVNGLGACLDGFADNGQPLAVTSRTKLEQAGIGGFTALAQKSYLQMTEETAKGDLKPADEDTEPVIRQLMDRGHEIVIVSNSGTQRIQEILARVGLTPVAHEQDPGARFRVRGNARKFHLGNTPRTLSVGPYNVETDRPDYETILREEKPDLVIGDVFSLDLALPLYLGISGVKEFSGIRLCLRDRHYTPAWSRQYLKNTSFKEARCECLARFSELLDFL